MNIRARPALTFRAPPCGESSRFRGSPFPEQSSARGELGVARGPCGGEASAIWRTSRSVSPNHVLSRYLGWMVFHLIHAAISPRHGAVLGPQGIQFDIERTQRFSERVGQARLKFVLDLGRSPRAPGMSGIEASVDCSRVQSFHRMPIYRAGFCAPPALSYVVLARQRRRYGSTHRPFDTCHPSLARGPWRWLPKCCEPFFAYVRAADGIAAASLDPKEWSCLDLARKFSHPGPLTSATPSRGADGRLLGAALFFSAPLSSGRLFSLSIPTRTRAAFDFDSHRDQSEGDTMSRLKPVSNGFSCFGDLVSVWHGF